MNEKNINELTTEISELKDKIAKMEKYKVNKRNDHYFRSLFEQVAVGIAIVSNDGTWLRINKKICDILGYSSDELEKKSISEMLHPDDDSKNRNLIDDFFAGKINNIWLIVSYVNRYNIKGWMNLRISSSNKDDSSNVCIIDDITEQKNAQIDRERLLKESLKNVETLNGLLPICASCKKIRDDDGYWDQIETYIQKHSEAEFSHSLCPTCTEDLYGNEEWYEKKIKETK